MILTGSLAPLVLFWTWASWLVAFAYGNAGVLPVACAWGGLVVAVRLWSGLSPRGLWCCGRVLRDPYLRRKGLRFLFLFFPLVIFPLFGPSVFRSLLLALAVMAFTVEVGRSLSTGMAGMLAPIFKNLGRPSEASSVSGVTLFLMGSGLTALFPGSAGPLGVTVLIAGDGLASLVGRRWGRWFWRPGKSGWGTVACLLASGTAVLLVIPELWLEPGKLAVLMMVSAFAEASFRGGWDNLFTGPAVALVFWLLQG